MRSAFTQLADVVKSRLQSLGLEGAVRERTALEVWEEIVGEKIAAATKPTRVRDGILYVNCKDSLWAQELHFLRPTIVQKLNKRIGTKAIKEIRLSGVGFGKSRGRKEEDAVPKKRKHVPQLTNKDTAEIEQAVSGIDDTELAQRVEKGLRASKLLRKRQGGGQDVTVDREDSEDR